MLINFYCTFWIFTWRGSYCKESYFCSNRRRKFHFEHSRWNGSRMKCKTGQKFPFLKGNKASHSHRKGSYLPRVAVCSNKFWTPIFETPGNRARKEERWAAVHSTFQGSKGADIGFDYLTAKNTSLPEQAPAPPPIDVWYINNFPVLMFDSLPTISLVYCATYIDEWVPFRIELCLCFFTWDLILEKDWRLSP